MQRLTNQSGHQNRRDHGEEHRVCTDTHKEVDTNGKHENVDKHSVRMRRTIKVYEKQK